MNRANNSNYRLATEEASARLICGDRRSSWAKRQFTGLLGRLASGNVTLVEPHEVARFGNRPGLHATVSVKRDCFYRKALFGPVSIANSFVEGDWDCDDLTSLIQIFLRNRSVIDQSKRWPVRIANFGSRLFHWFHANTVRGSQKNISAHYDLGNEFYRLWLDESMAYSSGIFLNQSSTMLEASQEKFDRICRKLNLQADDNVLEIGTGFGGFALHAAEQFGCQIGTTTISQQQFDLAADRFGRSPAGSRIDLMKQDYRSLQGKYDKLVSIEMIEAVGHRYLDDYFKKCSSLLRPDGSMVIQAIVMPEQGYDRYLNSVDFIQRYVFPGGCLPSLTTILESVGRKTDLRFVHAEDMAPHYAETLRRWRNSFLSQLGEIRRLGYSEKLIRLWKFYLSYCIAAFEERRIGVLQIQFDKPNRRYDPIQIGSRAASVSPPARTHRSGSRSENNQLDMQVESTNRQPNGKGSTWVL